MQIKAGRITARNTTETHLPPLIRSELKSDGLLANGVDGDYGLFVVNDQGGE